jgi:selenophosphate synthetase-related protein
LTIDLSAIPRPEGVALEKWLRTFPSFGFLLSVAPANVAAVIGCFAGRGIHAADIGAIDPGSVIKVTQNGDTETIWDFSRQTLMGYADA